MRAVCVGLHIVSFGPIIADFDKTLYGSYDATPAPPWHCFIF